jgi:hypothetical protein
VPIIAADSSEARRIATALMEWRQGDLALDESWFIHAGDPAVPLTDAAAGTTESGLQALMSETLGLAVVTQTCDIVRACVSRPYVEVSPVVRVSATDLHAIRRGRRPAMATLPALLGNHLAIDLDRVMTVEKSVVASWKRTPGYTSDDEGRTLAQALARKRARFAFPDDFNRFSKKLQDRLTEKHEKSTDEGRGLRTLREIRVAASPDWTAPVVELMFWFVRDDAHADFNGTTWADLLRAWLKLIPASGRFASTEGQVVTLVEMTAADYVMSDRIDLDHLSSGLEDDSKTRNA